MDELRAWYFRQAEVQKNDVTWLLLCESQPAGAI
jgi:hypothetical protein